MNPWKHTLCPRSNIEECTHTHTHTHCCAYSLKPVSPHLKWENHTKVHILPMVLSPQAVLYFPWVSTKCIVLSSQSLESDRSHVTHTTFNTQWEAMQTVMAAKLTRLTPKTDNMASSGRQLHNLLFLALVMSSGTFRYAFVLGSDVI